MDNTTADRLKHKLNTEVVRRMLIQYFRAKGFNETFNRNVYPAMLQDLTKVLPLLATKVEVEPHTVEVDPTTGRAILGWNLFVLGNHRMYLGETYHRNLTQLAKQIQAGQLMIPEGEEGGANARHQSTARQVVNFITRVLAKSESGYVDLNGPEQSQPVPSAIGQAGIINGSFYARVWHG